MEICTFMFCIRLGVTHQLMERGAGAIGPRTDRRHHETRISDTNRIQGHDFKLSASTGWIRP